MQNWCMQDVYVQIKSDYLNMQPGSSGSHSGKNWSIDIWVHNKTKVVLLQNPGSNVSWALKFSVEQNA